jgi:hypothetical protein
VILLKVNRVLRKRHEGFYDIFEYHYIPIKEPRARWELLAGIRIFTMAYHVATGV